MELLRYNDIDVDEVVKRSEEDVNSVVPIVSEILEDVSKNGDSAVNKYTRKFDNVDVEKLRVTDEEIRKAYENLDEEIVEALKSSAKNIEKFHLEEIPEEWEIEVAPGVMAGQIVRPIESVGCYIPGGKAVYPSSILMTVIPAKIAGVKRIVACSPPEIADAILVAADLAGVDEIYKVGGAQAIAAMAYGTESISKVDKIVGPGNIFVTAAKKLVYGRTDIDFPAGPSEVLILADKTAKPEYVAVDVLAQAEHDPNASCFVVTDDEALAFNTLEEINKLIPKAKRSDIIAESLEKSGKIVLCDNMKEAIEVTNKYAPEHLQIITEDDEAILFKINNAGSIFLGNFSPVPCGDYGSGTNHVLPTGGGAKMYSGLSTESFIKKPTVQRLTEEGLERLAETCIPIAEYEGLYSHADAIRRRLE